MQAVIQKFETSNLFVFRNFVYFGIFGDFGHFLDLQQKGQFLKALTK